MADKIDWPRHAYELAKVAISSTLNEEERAVLRDAILHNIICDSGFDPESKRHWEIMKTHLIRIMNSNLLCR
jgi:hypothetical protein